MTAVPSHDRLPARSLLFFDVGNQICALFVDAIVEILPMASLSRPPAAPTVIEGFLNLGGTAIPVVRTSRLLGLPDIQVGLYTPVIILRHTEGRWGLLVGTVRQVATTTQYLPIALKDHSAADHGVRFDEKLVPILSIEKLLLTQERYRIAELQEIQQRRLSELEGVHD